MKTCIATLCALALFTCIATNQASAKEGTTAVGIAFGLPNGGPGLSVRLDKIWLAAQWSLNDPGYLVVSGDYMIFGGEIVNTLEWYAGPGVYLAFNSNNFGLGVEVPIGLMWTPIEHLEIFGQAMPFVALLPEVAVDIQGGFGIRYVF